MSDVCDNKKPKTYEERYKEEMTLRKTLIQNIIPKIFSPGHSFPRQDSDPDFTVNVSNLVSFGDVKDAGNANPQNAEVGGTIMGYICTVRKFLPGNYKVTVMNLFDYQEKCIYIGHPLVIYHHEKIDPKKIGLQVIRLCQDYCNFHQGVLNSINRYDWCHWRNWDCRDGYKQLCEKAKKEGGKKAKKEWENPLFNEEANAFIPEKASTIYFTQSENAEQLEENIRLGHIRQSSIIPELYSVYNESGTISIAVDYGALVRSDFLFAKVFQDVTTEDYFALVVNTDLGILDSEVGLPDFKPESVSKIYQQYGFTTVSKSGLKFNMAEFMH